MCYINYKSMQASPIGMASASQADFGGFDSRRLLQKKQRHFGVLLFLKFKALRESRGGKSAETTADKTVRWTVFSAPCSSGDSRRLLHSRRKANFKADRLFFRP